MEQLIKITTEPIHVERFTQKARVVESDNMDMERRKAIARQMSFRTSVGKGTISVEDINQINRTFSKKNASSENQQMIMRQPQSAPAAPAPVVSSAPSQKLPTAPVSEAAPVAASASSISSDPVSVPDIAAQTSSSYTAQRGSFEMRVAKGDLTYLPPLVMTIVTQRPQVHVEYIGGFNYVPPIDGDSGGNVNLFT